MHNLSRDNDPSWLSLSLSLFSLFLTFSRYFSARVLQKLLTRAFSPASLPGSWRQNRSNASEFGFYLTHRRTKREREREREREFSVDSRVPRSQIIRSVTSSLCTRLSFLRLFRRQSTTKRFIRARVKQVPQPPVFRQTATRVSFASVPSPGEGLCPFAPRTRNKFHRDV